MPRFLDEIKVTVQGGLRELNFQTTEDMERWLDAEEPFWKDLDIRSMQQNLRNNWNTQQVFYTEAHRYLQQLEAALAANQEQAAKQTEGALRNHFVQISNGKIITSDYAIFPAIVDMAKINVDVAGLLYLRARTDVAGNLGTFSNQSVQLKTLLDLTLLYTRSEGTEDWLLPQRKELNALKKESQDSLSEICAKLDEQNKAIDGQRKDANEAHQGRESQWDSFKEKMKLEWEALKKLYDEQLALLAPTQYWSGRAQTHRNAAIGFAIAFGILLLVSVGLFAWLAMPHLFTVAGDKQISPILTLIPVVVPAFAGVWVLKILSRLLSENLQMMRDARERETMVKTFLALMREDKNGKSIINDNDRILILHSLFRPSSIAAVDDAPPVHWFDILSNKVGPNTSGR